MLYFKKVRVLFEETFYNTKKESFQVLCIDQPLEGGLGRYHSTQYPGCIDLAHVHILVCNALPLDGGLGN